MESEQTSFISKIYTKAAPIKHCMFEVVHGLKQIRVISVGARMLRVRTPLWMKLA